MKFQSKYFGPFPINWKLKYAIKNLVERGTYQSIDVLMLKGRD
jgi:hypothetical protein